MEHLFINTEASNVELTDTDTNLIKRRLATVTRILRQAGGSRLEVSIREIDTPAGNVTYVVMLKTLGKAENFMATATKPHLGLALSAAAILLRRSMTRGASVVDNSALGMTPRQYEAYTLTL